MLTFDILFPNCNFINNKPDPYGKGMDVNDTNSNKNITHWGLSTLLACGSLRRSPDSDSWLETQNHLLSWRVPQPRWRGGFHSCIPFPSKVYGKVSNKPQKPGTNLNVADIILHMFLFQWTRFYSNYLIWCRFFPLFTLWTVNFSHSINFLVSFAFWRIWLFVHIYFNARFSSY